MNYLLDRKLKRKKFYYFAFFVALVIVLFYFRTSTFYGLSYVSSGIFRSVLVFGNNIGGKFSNIFSFFVSKGSLARDNEDLKLKLSESEARVSNYNSILAENIQLKEVLGRFDEGASTTLAAILGRPNQSPYDTIIIDVGANHGLQTGNTVFAFGNVPVGRIAEVYANSSKVILFSSSGEKTNVIISLHQKNDEVVAKEGEADIVKDVAMEIFGRGGGNFEMILPRDVTVQNGDEATLPGIKPYVVGIVETIISDPRDSFQKALLVSPVNILELKFVEVQTD